MGHLRCLLSLALLFSTLPSLEAAEPPLQAVFEAVRANAAQGKKSFLLMDLDETVVDSHTRKYVAYRAAIEELCGPAKATIRVPKSEDCERALGLAMHDIYRSENGYSQPELMEKLGIRDASFIRDLYRRRRELEDTPRWFELDTLMPGASRFVRDLKRAGATVYFVSSRTAETLTEATYAQLIAHGILEESEKSTVILRPRGQSSRDFKRESALRLEGIASREGASVVALFENEPSNLAAWMDRFPGAHAFFVSGSFATSDPIPPSATVISTYR